MMLRRNLISITSSTSKNKKNSNKFTKTQFSFDTVSGPLCSYPFNQGKPQFKYFQKVQNCIQLLFCKTLMFLHAFHWKPTGHISHWRVKLAVLVASTVRIPNGKQEKLQSFIPQTRYRWLIKNHAVSQANITCRISNKLGDVDFRDVLRSICQQRL